MEENCTMGGIDMWDLCLWVCFHVGYFARFSSI